MMHFVNLLLFAALGHCHLQRRGVEPTGKVDEATVKGCTYWYDTKSGDTCLNVLQEAAISQEVLTSYNPSLKSNCAGILSGYSYCVEVNYGNDLTPTVPPSATVTPTLTSQPPSQPSYIATCEETYIVVNGDSCLAIADKFKISLEAFYDWNPKVGTGCQNLWLGGTVCVRGPLPRITSTITTSPLPTSPEDMHPKPHQSGLIATCLLYYKAKKGDSCWSITNGYNSLSIDQFIKWNPAVGNDCINLWPNYNYCVGVTGQRPAPPKSTSLVPGDHQPRLPGTISSCKKFYKVQKGQGCWDIQQSQKVSTEAWAKWNPGINGACSNLLGGGYVCIGV